MNMNNQKPNKRSAKTTQRKSNNIEAVLDECNSKMSAHGASLNLLERNNLLISIIRKDLGNLISISTEGSVDNNVYNQHSVITDLSSETIVAEHKMSESQQNLDVLAKYLEIPSIPSIVIESVSLAQALNIFGCSGSTISPPSTKAAIAITNSTTNSDVEEQKSDATEDDIVITSTSTPAQPTEPVVETVQEEIVETAETPVAPEETITASTVETPQEDKPTANEEADSKPSEEQVDEKDDIIVPITSARKRTDTSSLEISQPVEPMFEMISESSIRKFFAIMHKLDISEETVLSFLNIKEGSGEPVPTSVATMTKGQGYRVLNRLKQAEKNQEPMVKLLDARRAEFGDFSRVRDAANDSVEKKKVK